MKTWTVVTTSGSKYLFRENHAGQIEVHVGETKPNPNVSTTHREGWWVAEVMPWPPQVEEIMVISRPDVPWGSGALKRTSPVVMVEYPEEDCE